MKILFRLVVGGALVSSLGACSRGPSDAESPASGGPHEVESWHTSWVLVEGTEEGARTWYESDMSPDQHLDRPTYDPDRPRTGILALRPGEVQEMAGIQYTGAIPEGSDYLVVEACGDYRDDTVLICIVNGRPAGVNMVPGTQWTTLKFPISGYLAEENEIQLQATVGGQSSEGPEDCYIDAIYFDSDS